MDKDTHQDEHSHFAARTRADHCCWSRSLICATTPRTPDRYDGHASGLARMGRLPDPTARDTVFQVDP